MYEGSSGLGSVAADGVFVSDFMGGRRFDDGRVPSTCYNDSQFVSRALVNS